MIVAVVAAAVIVVSHSVVGHYYCWHFGIALGVLAGFQVARVRQFAEVGFFKGRDVFARDCEGCGFAAEHGSGGGGRREMAVRWSP